MPIGKKMDLDLNLLLYTKLTVSIIDLNAN